MTHSASILRATASWNRTSRFWLAWPSMTGMREHDAAAQGDSVALAQLLADYAPVTVVAASADVIQCSLQMPAGVRTLVAASGQMPLAMQPLWLADATGALLAGVAAGAEGSRQLAEAAGVDVANLPAGWQADVIESDGEGTALVLERLAADLAGGRDEAERLLAEKLGITQVIWLRDPGSGRVPARYLAPGVVAAPLGHDANHPAFAALAANSERLRQASDRKGRRLSVVELPCPSRQRGCYSDLMVAGDLVVVPEFEEGRDSHAFDQVVAAMPAARVMAFPATHLAQPGSGLGRSVLAQPKLN